MKLALDIQTLASISVVGSFVASECAAWQLDTHPGSRLAWRLNVGMFGAFEHARLGSGGAHLLFSPASLPLGFAVLAAILAARLSRCRLAVAFFANVSFMASAALAYGVASEKLAHRAAWSPLALAHDGRLPLVVAILVASVAGFSVSHWAFLRTILADTRSPARPGLARAKRSFVRPFLRVERHGSANRPSAAVEYC